MEGQVAETEKKTASKKTEAKKEASPAKAKQEKEIAIPKNGNIYQKLSAVRVIMQGRLSRKSGVNPEAGFTYFELRDFIPESNRLFNEAGMLPVFRMRRAENGFFEASLEIINTEKTEESISFTLPVVIGNGIGMQAIGASDTYARRYLYMNALEITENDQIDKPSVEFERSIIAQQQQQAACQQPVQQAPGQQAQQQQRPALSKEDQEKARRIFDVYKTGDEVIVKLVRNAMTDGGIHKISELPADVIGSIYSIIAARQTERTA